MACLSQSAAEMEARVGQFVTKLKRITFVDFVLKFGNQMSGVGPALKRRTRLSLLRKRIGVEVFIVDIDSE